MESRQELLEIISGLERKKSDYLNSFFKNCPEAIIRSIKYVKVPKDYHLIQADSECNNAYIILNGKARGIDLQSVGTPYIFMESTGIDVVGDFEIFGGISKYRMSIQTVTECEIMVVPAKKYLDWMTKDVNALFMRTRTFMYMLTNQTANERKNIFLGCKERMIIYLIEQYEKFGHKKEYIIQKNQTELAECVGFNVRTIQRNIRILEAEGLIKSIAGRISITYIQYLNLKNYADKNLMN